MAQVDENSAAYEAGFKAGFAINRLFTFVGKVLVILTATISILCLMGAVGVFTQKMDYVTPRGGDAGKKTLNRVDDARKKAKDLLAANQRAVTRMSLEMEPLIEHEIDHLERRDYYSAQMEMMRTGKWRGQVVANPIQVLPPYEKSKDGTELLKIPVDKEVAPALDPILVVTNNMNTRVQPASYYVGEPGKPGDGEIRRVQKDIDAKVAATRKLIGEHVESTLVINGSDVPGMERKGLRTRIKEQILIKEDAIAETEFLEDYVSRRQAEAELFVKRRDAMADRLVELKKFFKIKEEPAVPGN